MYAIKHVIIWTIFFTWEWLWFGVPESYAKKQFMHLTVWHPGGFGDFRKNNA